MKLGLLTLLNIMFINFFLSAQGGYKSVYDTLVTIESDPTYNPPKVKSANSIAPDFGMNLLIGISRCSDSSHIDSLHVSIDNVQDGASKPFTFLQKSNLLNDTYLKGIITSCIKKLTGLQSLRKFYRDKITAVAQKVNSSIKAPNDLHIAALPNSYATFPSGAVEGGSFTVTKEFATINNGGTLYLPENFRIRVENDVDEIKWSFRKVVFGKSAIISLIRFINYKLPANSGRDILIPEEQPDYGKKGYNGENGENGANGLDGANFQLKTFTLSTTGNLWIRTDGGMGQNGGQGGNGGLGGGDRCPGFRGPEADGGPGGDGGRGGIGGNGGSTSKVDFALISEQTGSVILTLNSTCLEGCGLSSFPGNSEDDTGIIIISGRPGCPGLGGYGGKGGPGHPGRTCLIKKLSNGAQGKDFEKVQSDKGKPGKCR